MSILKNIIGHFNTIRKHRKLVRQGCFKVGLYKQGIMHDLSKYSLEEFIVGAKYYQGYRSPNAAEREKKGYSTAWLHHKGRNKHHFEYWLDYSSIDDKNIIVGVKMPTKYVVEMLVDRISACKTYQKDKYTNKSPLIYYENSRIKPLLHKDTRALLEKLLHMVADIGEEETYRYIRKEILKNKK